MNDRIPILIDTDANNELDDQHAIAYAAFNSKVFDLVGVTVNNTPLGDGIEGQYNEALRVLKLCQAADQIPLFKGAERNYLDIQPELTQSRYDGQDAVEFIVEQARKNDGELVLIPIGKLTNIALALDVAPDIVEKVRVVWLGSNYPEPGEYNLIADQDAVRRVIDSDVKFEIVTVRYTKTTGSTAVSVSIDEIRKIMPGLGPTVPTVEGRRGGTYTTFGDYSIALFEEINMPTRPLFDVVAVAVVKNPQWGQTNSIPAPLLIDGGWEDRPNHPRQVVLWEHFDRDAIINDLINSFKNYQLPR